MQTIEVGVVTLVLTVTICRYSFAVCRGYVV